MPTVCAVSSAVPCRPPWAWHTDTQMDRINITYYRLAVPELEKNLYDPYSLGLLSVTACCLVLSCVPPTMPHSLL